ncbi:Bax inhibitor-1/YccA family protein [Raineyella sp. W15-4]|uniref:Bax inhibitor-1/YccA family protein n=1 Tax=Raineyella sp. W15-4 TaxID=3081651 RepID=UPI0029555E7F|nr:Bax inhibitor-1/YccA family protein [Raineyella sp. W15-4]WOQ16061.1 Bax inhibitor-1/YccA family protein [Raineyella sp. W15-4]
MRSNNPVLNRSASFNPRAGSQAGYAPQYQGRGFDPYAAPQPVDRMTMDDVVTKTALTLGVVVLTAAASWFLVPPALVGVAWIGSAIAALVVSFLVIGRRGVRPGMVIAYAALEGVFIGIFSSFLEGLFPGIVVQAVIATFVVAGLVLASYKIFNLNRFANRISRGLFIATGALAVVYLVNFVLSLFGVHTGLIGFGPQAGGLAFIVTAVAIVLATMNLLVDFAAIEDGVRNGAPADQSWVAAFGLTVTMVWLYTELLRLLSYFRSN